MIRIFNYKGITVKVDTNKIKNKGYLLKLFSNAEKMSEIGFILTGWKKDVIFNRQGFKDIIKEAGLREKSFIKAIAKKAGKELKDIMSDRLFKEF